MEEAQKRKNDQSISECVRKHKLLISFVRVVVAGVVQHVWAAVDVGSTGMAVLTMQPRKL